jgi:hypothetical protein
LANKVNARFLAFFLGRAYPPDSLSSKALLLEWELAKIEASKRKVITLEREEEREETQVKIAQNFISLGLDNATIAKGTNLTVEQIEKLRQGKPRDK